MHGYVTTSDKHHNKRILAYFSNASELSIIRYFALRMGIPFRVIYCQY